MNEKFTQDTKELELPETLYVRDIETRVFQAIVLQILSSIEGISMLEGNLIDSFLGRDGADRVKGIHVDQDPKHHAVRLKIEVNIKYGLSLPQKAEEIQMKTSEAVSKFTGLHVSRVHVVFNNVILPKLESTSQEELKELEELKEEYSGDF